MELNDKSIANIKTQKSGLHLKEYITKIEKSNIMITNDHRFAKLKKV